MAVRRIRQLGDPILRIRCERVQNPKSAATRLVADDLRDSLAIAKKKYKMGRALAAPQIGAPVRKVLVQMEKQRWTKRNLEMTDDRRDGGRERSRMCLIRDLEVSDRHTQQLDRMAT